MDSDEYQELLRKYKEKVAQEFGGRSSSSSFSSSSSDNGREVSSKEYFEFKREFYPAHYTWYEHACNFSDHLLKLKVSGKSAERTQKDLQICHLQTTAAGVTAFAVVSAMVIMIFGSFIAFLLPLLLGKEPLLFFVLFFLAAGAVIYPAVQKIPSFMANSWRMKASNQMVQSIFYMVTYLRHTSNFERAIAFAADHLEPPLSLDFRKILWDVETQHYSTIRDASEQYLEMWKEWDKDFVEAFYLLQSSLYEGSEERRLTLLDKALDVVLTGTYENMLHYAHDLKSPMTMLHMLGIVLPILGLVILPLVVSFMGTNQSPLTTTLYIALLYNIVLPLGVLYLGKVILSKRPAGYGAVDISDQQNFRHLRMVEVPLGKSLTIRLNPVYFCLFLFLLALLIGISPLLFHAAGFQDFAFDQQQGLKFLDYVCPADKPICQEAEKIGPYGIGASLLSLIFIAGMGIAWGLYYSLRSANVMKVREKTRLLEEEFSSALFQLGNRLGDGLPAEIAFSKVAETMQGTTSGEFFQLAERNMVKLGMGLEQSLFDPKVGALGYFPSKVITSSMKVMVESLRKGPRIAAQALLSMSRYIKEIHRVEERLRDLMADVIASMKSQIIFLTPAIAGIVIGITSMISTILTKLSAQLTCFTNRGQEVGNFGDLLTIFGLGAPTYYFQIVVGIYIVQIIYILTSLSSGIENGADPLGERYALGRYLIRSTVAYCIIAAIVMVLFNFFATTIMSSTLASCAA